MNLKELSERIIGEFKSIIDLSLAMRSASNDSTHPQRLGRREGEDSPSSSVISREDIALVVDVVLKSLR